MPNHPVSISLRNKLEHSIRENLAFGDMFWAAFARVPTLAGRQVLEIGCGDGSESVLFALHGAQVVGIDKREKALYLGEQLADLHGVLDQCTFTTGFVEDLAYPDDTFDFVFSKSVLQYTDRRQVIDECMRVLKPGGTLMLIENLPNNPIVKVSRLIRRLAATERDNRYLNTIQGYLSYKDAKEIERSLDHGSCEFQHFVSPLIIFWIWSDRLARLPFAGGLYRFSRAIDSLLLGTLPPLKRLAWIGCVMGTKPLAYQCEGTG